MHKNSLITRLVVRFYEFWHGRLRLKGSGLLLRACAQFLPGFKNYRLNISDIGPITINLKDSSGISWLNYTLGEVGLEDGLICAVIKLAPKDPIIWDVGANAGFFATALIQRLKSYTEIRLFEPNPKLISGLRELADLLPNAHAHHLPFSDKPGTARLYIPKSDSSTASFNATADFISVNVECTTGDLFLNESGAAHPDVVIIDTEGNDCRVITGLTELINRKHPVIFFENIFEAAETIGRTLPQNYHHFTVDDKSGELLPELDKSRGHNSVFVPST